MTTTTERHAKYLDGIVKQARKDGTKKPYVSFDGELHRTPGTWIGVFPAQAMPSIDELVAAGRVDVVTVTRPAPNGGTRRLTYVVAKS